MLRISLEERKAYIAVAALKIFVEKGYKSASLQQIAEKVEITKAGIYHYFKTKEEILHFILVQSNLQNIISLRKVDPTNNGSITQPHQMLSHIIRSYANLSLAAGDVALLALRERHQLTGTNLESYQEMEREILNLLKKNIKAVPRIKSKYEINTIIFMITSMNAWLGYWVKNEGPLSKDEIVEQSIEIICSGALKH
jgi:TetR/AcrR family transcriptional regulator, cholesterol catabolism regulator